VLSQTYDNIEMFVIDDGSTDNTKQTVLGYIEQFQNRGFALHYVYQENQGLAPTINNGLKLIRGDYLAWPDADDFYAEPGAIAELAAALENTSEETAGAGCFFRLVDEEDLKVIGEYYGDCLPGVEIKYDFEDILFNRTKYHFGNYGSLVKTDHLFSALKGREIFTTRRGGQNIQLVLPVLYKYKIIIVGNFLFNILMRKGSHSRIKDDRRFMGAHIDLQTAIRDTYISVIGSMNGLSEERKKYLTKEIVDQYNVILFGIFFKYGKTREALNVFHLADKKSQWITGRTRIYVFLCHIPFGYLIINIAKKLFGRKIVR
jgi:glycosyltransferase involved in cell wall biosynthesis